MWCIPKAGGILATCVLALGLAGMATPAHAAIACDVNVLKEAINTANTAGSGTIVLARNCTYTLTTVDNTTVANGPNGLPVITGDITLQGGPDTVIARSAVAATPFFRILEVAARGELTVKSVTLRNGNPGPTFAGGAVFVNDDAAASLVASKVVSNTSADGGAVYSEGNLSVRASALNSNSALSSGGAISTDSNGTTTVWASNVFGNTAGTDGGGIAAYGGILVVKSSNIASNTAGDQGGGIYTAAAATISSSNIASNTAVNRGGGIFSCAGLTVRSSAISANRVTAPTSLGGALFNNAGAATFTGSFVVGNRAVADGGGVYELAGVVTLKGSRVAGNIPNNCRPVASVPGCIN